VKSWQYAEFGGPEKLTRLESETPAPGAGEVRLRVAYCGVNPVDMSTMRGRFANLPLPHTPGCEVAGVVDAVGPGVESPPVGTRVAVAFRRYCDRCYSCLRGREIEGSTYLSEPGLPILGVQTNGGFAEYLVIPARNAIPVPAGLSLAQACAAALDGATARHLVDRAGVRAGENVLVVGATGGIGTYGVQFAARRGATVWALARGAEAAERLRALGAAAVIDREQEDVNARIRELSAGRGVDVALDPLGAVTWPMSIAALAQGGRYATCGVLTGAQVTLDLGPFYNRQQQIIGSTGGSRGDLAETLAATVSGQVEGMIWRTYPLDEAPQAMAALSDPGRLGKVLLEIGGV
jgi:NADPH:quinone reductase-like Zn-dependent oxidoreductase